MRVTICWTFALLCLLHGSIAGAEPASYTYDNAGRLASEWVGNVRVEYTYDASGNLLSQTSCTADCYIADECWVEGEVNPADECLACASATSRTEWASIPCGADMGPGADMGTPPGGDMGTEPGDDMGSGMPGGDTGTEGGGGNDDGSDGGCNCSTAGNMPDFAPFLLFLGFLGLRRRRRRRRVATISTLLILLIPSVAAAVTVCPDGSCDYTTIGEALANSGAGDLVSVKPGTYNEFDLTMNGERLISTTPTDASSVIIDAQQNGPVFQAAGGTLQGITIRNGRDTLNEGGGIRGGNLVLRNMIIENNQTTRNGRGGGGIGGVSGGDLTVIDTIIRNNTSRGAGGGIGGAWRHTVLVNVTFQGNTANDATVGRGGGASFGGVAFGAQTLVIRNCTFDGNTAMGTNSSSGGGLLTDTPAILIENSSFTGNSALGGSGRGGGISLSGGASVLSNVTVTGNTASNEGGGIVTGTGGTVVEIFGGSVSGNTANAVGDGGGIFCGRPQVAVSASVMGNTPDQVAGACTGCTAATTQTCMTSLPGACAMGEQTCSAAQVWEPCAPLVTPPPTEMMCMDGADEDCDGKTDATDPDCQSARPTTRAQTGGAGEKGDPISTFTGELFTRLPSDLDVGGPIALEFRRYYASGLDALGLSGRLGTNWRHSFEWSLVTAGGTATITDAQGRTIDFEDVNGSWELTGFEDVSFRLWGSGGTFGYWMYDPRTGRVYDFDDTGVLTKISDGEANAITLTYAAGDLMQATDGYGRTLDFTYDAGGMLDSVTDGTRIVTFSHAGNSLTAVTDVLGGSTTFNYAAGGLLTSMTTPAGTVPSTQTYNAEGRVVSQTEAGQTTTFAYDDVIGTCTITGPNGTTVHTHDMRGHLVEVQQPSGAMLDMSYDAAGRRAGVSDVGGAMLQTTYDEGSEHPTSLALPDGLTITYDLIQRYNQGAFYAEIGTINYPDGTTESFAYNDGGHVTELVDRAGGVARFTYNDVGQTLTATNQAGGTTTYAYDASGLLVTETDPAGNDVIYSYDAAFRHGGTSYADGASRAVAHDDADRVTAITDERGNTRSFGYDGNGNLTSITDAAMNITTLTWDALGRLESYTDPVGNTSTVSYDASGRISGQTNRSGGMTTLQYDSDGRLVTMIDAAGESWTRTYQQNGWLASLTDPLNSTIMYEYDAAGRLTLIRSPLGNATTYTYDVLGRVATETDASGGTTTYAYDARGYLTAVEVPGGVTAAFTRDDLGNVTAVTDQGGAVWQFAYDDSGRLTSRTDPLGNQVTRTYDNRNRPSSWSLPGAFGTVAATYDPMGNLIAQDYSAGPNLAFTYDARNLLTATEGVTLAYDENELIVSSNGIDTTRDPDGRVETVTYPPGDVTYTYDSAGRLVQLDDWLGNTTTFAYDAAGRRTSIQRPNNIDTTIGYDPDNNIQSIDEGALSSIDLQRNELGNIVGATRDVPTLPALPGDDLSFGYDAASQVDTFTYDALGRRTDDDLRSYTWDAASRLTSYTEGGSTVTFGHDGLLYVTSRTANGTTAGYVWNHAHRRPTIAVIRRDGTDRAYYVHTPDGELLYSVDAASDEVRYYHFDEMGNTLFLTDESGAVTDSYGYTAYGELTAQVGTTENPFTFGGQYGVVGDGSGLYLMGRRFYDSRTKRFISREPVPDMTHPRLVNPYAYAVGNPLRYIDPTGEANEDKSQPKPAPESLKNALAVNKSGSALAAKWAEQSAAIAGESIAAANGINRANEASRLLGKAVQNPEWVDAGLKYARKLENVGKVAEGFGTVGKLAGLAVSVKEDGPIALVQEASTMAAEKAVGKRFGAAKGKGAAALVGVLWEGYKLNDKVGKVQSQLRDDQLSNIANYYRIVDNTLEALRAKIITEEECVRRIKAAQEAFDETSGGAKDNGVFGVLEESARGLNAMLGNLIGL